MPDDPSSSASRSGGVSEVAWSRIVAIGGDSWFTGHHDLRIASFLMLGDMFIKFLVECVHN